MRREETMVPSAAAGKELYLRNPCVLMERRGWEVDR